MTFVFLLKIVMKKIVFSLLLITTCYVLSNVDTAFAKIRSGMAEAGLFGGVIMLDDSNGDDDETLAGFDLTIHYTDDWALNISFMNQLSKFDEMPSFNLYTIAGQYKFAPKYRLSPYLLLGLGAGTFIPDPDTNKIRFILTVGGGAKYFIMKRVALKAEIRDYITTNEVNHNIAGTVGIMYIFDLLAPFGTSSEAAEPWQTSKEREEKGDPGENSSFEKDIELSSEDNSIEEDKQSDEVPEGTEELIEEDIEEISPEPIGTSPQQDTTPPTDNIPAIEEEMNEPSEAGTDGQPLSDDPSSGAPGFKVLER